MTRTGIDDSLLRQAVEWLVLIRSGTAGPAETDRFRAWREASSEHAAACARVEQSLRAFGVLREFGVSAETTQQALRQARARASRRLTLAVAGLGVGAVAAGWRGASEVGMLADARAGRAQRVVVALPAGGSMQLDAQTAVDLAVGGDPRHWRLHRGRFMAQTLAGAGSWVIDSPLGQVITEAARFVVGLAEDESALQVTALSGGLAVVSRGGMRTAVEQGQRVTLSRQGEVSRVAARPEDTLWTRGLVALDNEPLGLLVEALRPYRAGVLRVSPAAAQLRISGVFSLDDTEDTLRVLAQTQAVRVSRLTSYWVTISEQ